MNGIKEMNSMLMLKTWSLRSTLRLKTFQYKIHSRLPRTRCYHHHHHRLIHFHLFALFSIK